MGWDFLHKMGRSEWMSNDCFPWLLNFALWQKKFLEVVQNNGEAYFEIECRILLVSLIRLIIKMCGPELDFDIYASRVTLTLKLTFHHRRAWGYAERFRATCSTGTWSPQLNDSAKENEEEHMNMSDSRVCAKFTNHAGKSWIFPLVRRVQTNNRIHSKLHNTHTHGQCPR